MTDIFDRATELEERQREAAINAQLKHRPQGASASKCQNQRCNEPIPPARRKAYRGVKHCVDCQQHLEKYGRLP